MTNKKCELKQFSDQMKCMTCGEAWDMNDRYPPGCPLERQVTPTRYTRILNLIQFWRKKA